MSECCCGFCGRVFEPDEGQPTCASCPLKGGCQLVRCPHCGYENPLTPAWLTRVRSWFATPAARPAGYDGNGDRLQTSVVDGADCGEAKCR